MSIRSSAVSTRVFVPASAQKTSRFPYRTATAWLSTLNSSFWSPSSTFGSPNCTPSIAATIRRRAFCAALLSFASTALLCAFSASTNPAGSSSSCKITESTASAIMSVSGSLDHSINACSTPVLPVAFRFTIVRAPALTLRPSGSAKFSFVSTPNSSLTPSSVLTSTSAGSSFFTFFLPEAFGCVVGNPPPVAPSLVDPPPAPPSVVTVWIPSKSASNANLKSPSGFDVGIICRCVTAAVLSFVYSGKSRGATSTCPKSFLTSKPRTRSPSFGGCSASAPMTFAVFDPECFISTAWQFFGEYTCIFFPSAATLPSSARFSLPISPASPCTSTTCGGARASRNCWVCG
mmetsp:Transcript_632/g.2444  ORF Transcript_632/g.2444 Transcript_632/m.2444 type:complete len:347 (-) Transcript_632:1291-2331(-)